MKQILVMLSFTLLNIGCDNSIPSIEQQEDIAVETEKPVVTSPPLEAVNKKIADTDIQESPESPDLPETITNSIGMKLQFIPAGEFKMGAPKWDKNQLAYELPPHQVRITRPFYLGTTEVTQGQWKAIMKSEPWVRDDLNKSGDKYPATNVDWEDALCFCIKLTDLEGRPYRLPTEAEWEYACRAGTTTPYSFTEESSILEDYAWFDANTKKAGLDYANEVGSKLPNPWGLYDMHGNVWEWCQDWFGADYYKDSPADDPKGPYISKKRVVRGGSYGIEARFCRSSNRNHEDQSLNCDDIGFRIVLELEETPLK